jgi:hypothetical protein
MHPPKQDSTRSSYSITVGLGNLTGLRPYRETSVVDDTPESACFSQLAEVIASPAVTSEALTYSVAEAALALGVSALPSTD